MEKLNKRIGVLGGGQLGKMLLEAASPLALDLHILDIDESFPAYPHTAHFIKGDFTKFEDVVAFGNTMDVVTIEIESVNEDALFYLAQNGVAVYPQPEILQTIKDKGLQKSFYTDRGMPTSPFRLFGHSSEILEAIDQGELTLPFVQKLRKDGYDGRGVQIIRSKDDLSHLFTEPSLTEDLISIQKEISVIVARNKSGEISTFPVVDMEFHPTANLVEFLYAPSAMSKEVQESAIDLAKQLAEALGIVGLLAVEMFVDADGGILINEVAPRPHNSGHQTIEGNLTSQYSQMLRALLDLPLGSTKMIQPSVMVNVLGEDGHQGPAKYSGLDDVLRVEGAYVHLYGKKTTKPFRKMGHVTITDPSLEEAIRKARYIQKTLKVIA